MMVLLYASELLKIPLPLCFYDFFSTTFNLFLCQSLYPSMLNHCHLLYIYDNIQKKSSRVIETQSPTSETQFDRQSFRWLQLEQPIAESR